MVDGGWGGLQAHSTTSIGYHLAFRAGGLRARSDTLSAAAESGTRRRGFAHFQRERAIAMQKKIDSRTPHIMGSATICLDSHGYARFSLEVCQTYPARAPLDGRRSRIGALGEATSSQNQVMTYPCYVRILKPSPPTIYHGQGLA